MADIVLGPPNKYRISDWQLHTTALRHSIYCTAIPYSRFYLLEHISSVVTVSINVQ